MDDDSLKWILLTALYEGCVVRMITSVWQVMTFPLFMLQISTQGSLTT